MSDTPRTDAQVRKENPIGEPGNTAVIATDFARQLERELTAWESELSKVMPPDYKDWWQNDKREWPLVARLVIEGKNRHAEFDAAAYDKLERELADALSDLEFRRGLYALQSERVARLERQLEQLKATLSDPAEVELAMIRGDIAIPDRVEFDGIRETKNQPETDDESSSSL